MAVIQDEVSIREVLNIYGSQYRQFRDLITQFESSQKYRITNKQNKLVENINQHHISRWESDNLHCFLGQNSYTDWEPHSACSASIVLK